MNYKFLIFGASGFVGAHLWEKAKQKNISAIGTTWAEEPGNFLNFNLAVDNLYRILPKNFLSSSDRGIAIILAGIASVDGCSKNKDLSYQVNVNGTIKLIADLQTAGVKIVYISSGAVFDGKSGNYDEASPVNPIIEYGRQKVQVEDYLQKTGSDFLIVRLSKVVSDNPGKKQIFSDFYRAIMAQEQINCFADETFSPTDANDVAQGIFLLIEKQLKGVYHLAGPEVLTREDLARKFFQVLGKDTQLTVKKAQDFGFKETRPVNMHLNSSKFQRDTGMVFKPMQQVITSFCKNAREYQYA